MVKSNSVLGIQNGNYVTSRFQSTYKTKFKLTWRNISVWIRKKRNSFSLTCTQKYEYVKILSGVSGLVQSGTLMTIMGVSGAGKTTLLTTIGQRLEGDIIGEILLNGQTVTKDLMSRVSGFVPQEELLVDQLTLIEHMQFMARLKMDSKADHQSRSSRIQTLLEELGLSKCTYIRLSSLSGGEMKRLSLAVQLLTDPPLLFCDEPTTGLDSYNAGIVVEKLQKVSASGKAVVCTIHQPTSGIFDMFDQVVLLAGGRVAYHGPVTGAAEYFTFLDKTCPSGYNQAEFFVSQLVEKDDGKHVQMICDHFQSSKNAELLKKQLTDGAVDSLLELTLENNILTPGYHEFMNYRKRKQVNWCIQFLWLSWRNFIQLNRNKKDIVIRFVLYMFIALLLSTPYLNTTLTLDQKDIQNLQGLMYLIITETIFTFAYAVFHTFPSEIPTLLREINNGLYHTLPYYVSKILIIIPIVTFETLSYTVVIYWIVGLKSGFLWMYLPVLMSALTATAYGFLLSAAFDSIETSSLVSVPIDFVTMCFSGIFINIAYLPQYLSWIPYTSQFFFGTEAISIAQWKQVDDIACENPNLPCFMTGKEVLKRYGFHETDYVIDVFGLILQCLICHLIGFGFLRRRSRKCATY